MRAVALGCNKFLRCYNNVNYDVESNRESRVLSRLGILQPRCIFDVGANTGDWSLLARRLCPPATVHAFEVVPETFQTLARKTVGTSQIVANAVGLSAEAGSVKIAHCTEDPGLSSAYAWSHGKSITTIECPVTTGDTYCAERQIGHIDFLKLDVEGAELPALRGFEHMLGRSAIDMIQFEYGYVNVMPRFLLADIYQYLNQRGYEVGKVYPNFVDFKAYDVHDEDFQGPNYIAIRPGLPELRQLLA